MKNASLSLLLCACAACGGPSKPAGGPDGAAADTVSAAAAAPDSAGGPTAVAAAVAKPPRSAVFPHEPHRSVACRTCHGAVRGHATHVGIACRECHAVPDDGQGREMTRAECLGCHHAADQRVGCATCHRPVEPRQVTRSVRLSVWSAARTVSLPFDHARHAAPGCGACHQTPPFLTPDRACGTCHDRHHRPDAVCASCHAQPPPGTHDARVHAGCSGSGCHAASTVAGLPRSRRTCEVCHRDRVDHYPDRDCSACHRLEPSLEDAP